MNKIPVLLVSTLALSLSIGTARAEVDFEELPQVPCSDLTFSAAFLAKYPRAPQACQDARVYNGKRYAKFDARVYISDPAFMTIELLNAEGETVSTFSFKPGPNRYVLVNGRERDFDDLSVGEKITIWVSEKRSQATKMPGSKEDQWAVLRPVEK